jgi:dihydropteroate synthase
MTSAPAVPVLRCGRFALALDTPRVMGVLNVTADSFSDGGRWLDERVAVERAWAMIDEGADLIDIGAESTRPGAPPVSAELELARLLPVLRALRDCGRPLSVDTRKPEVMRAVLDAGADMINDVAGFASADAIDAVRAGDCGLCVVHMRGEPRTMQHAPRYEDVVREVSEFLAERVAPACCRRGDRPDRRSTPATASARPWRTMCTFPFPAAPRIARPAVDGGLVAQEHAGPADRARCRRTAAASVAAAIAAVAGGAAIVRVHDVAATRDALPSGGRSRPAAEPSGVGSRAPGARAMRADETDYRKLDGTQVLRHRWRARHGRASRRSRRNS